MDTGRTFLSIATATFCLLLLVVALLGTSSLLFVYASIVLGPPALLRRFFPQLLPHATNRLAAHGAPKLEWPTFFPMAINIWVPSNWLLGVQWFIRWESVTQVLMLLQIVPVLLLPYQVLLNNVFEEVLSWFYGKYDMNLARTEEPIPDPLLHPWQALQFCGSILVQRMLRSLKLVMQWPAFLYTGKPEMENTNHAFVNYVAQGIDFSLEKDTFRGAFPTGSAISKKNAQVLAVCSRLSYERWNIVRSIVDRQWNTAGSSRPDIVFVAGYHFDVVQLGEDEKKRRVADQDTKAVLLRVGERAIILAFRGTDPLKNANWFTDFATAPPEGDECMWPHGKYHTGFREALGLNTRLRPDSTCKISYIIQKGGRSPHERMPGSSPADLEVGSPFEVLQKEINGLLHQYEDAKLYVTGHSLGGALGHLFTAAAVVPPDGPQWADKLGALYTYGQPRVGDYEYVSNLENIINRNRFKRRYTRVVNTNDIVARVPPQQVLELQFDPKINVPFFTHPGHLLWLPALPPRQIAANKAGKSGSDGDARRGRRKGVGKSEPIREGGEVSRVLPLIEQPTIFRTSSFLEACYKAVWHTQWANPVEPRLRTLSRWVVVLNFLPFVIPALALTGLTLPFALPITGVPWLLLLVAGVIGVLQAGLPIGLSDHSMDEYCRAIVDSDAMEWEHLGHAEEIKKEFNLS